MFFTDSLMHALGTHTLAEALYVVLETKEFINECYSRIPRESFQESLNVTSQAKPHVFFTGSAAVEL